MKVFLGGTCAGRKWRNEIIPLLTCDYYNPIVKGWNEEHRLREVNERQTADYVLYVLTADMGGVYSIAEVVDDSNKRPNKTILCILYDGFGPGMTRSLHAVENLVKENGAKVCADLNEVVKFLNTAQTVSEANKW